MQIKRQRRFSCDFILAYLKYLNGYLNGVSEFFQDGIMMADNLGIAFLMNVYNISMPSKVIIQKKSGPFWILQICDT